MSWEPWKDVEEFVSDIGKSVEKATSDVFKSDTMKVIGSALIGWAVGGIRGASIGAGAGLSTLQQEKGIEVAEELQEKQIAAQKEMQEKQIELETLKMEEEKLLMDLFTSQDQPLYITQPGIVTPAPIQAPVNYVLYIAIGIGILIYLGKIKL